MTPRAVRSVGDGMSKVSPDGVDALRQTRHGLAKYVDASAPGMDAGGWLLPDDTPDFTVRF